MNLTRSTRQMFKLIRLTSTRNYVSVIPEIVKSPQRLNKTNVVCSRYFSQFSKSPDYSEAPLLDLATYEDVSSVTLESLCDYFEGLVEADPKLQLADIEYSDGVLTVKLGSKWGTYVINRQTPNRQIWLSSPTSGPKRYDFIDDCWIYKHDGVPLHDLLQEELSKIMSNGVNFTGLPHGKKLS
ncbi:unnamed protein product [Diamesa serratosioi]